MNGVERIEWLDAEALDLSLFARRHDDGTLGMDLAVDGITCGGLHRPHRERG